MESLIEQAQTRRLGLNAASTKQIDSVRKKAYSRHTTGVSLASITVTYGQLRILNGFSHNFEPGQIHVLMGRNGCGKSTLLKAVAGQLKALSGEIHLGADGQQGSPTVEYMPQNYRQALFPWKNIRDNARPWLTLARPDSEEDTELIRALSSLELEVHSESFPYSLSGGQQQRAMLCRCVVSDAGIILLDEPFSAVDVLKRRAVSMALRDQFGANNKTVIAAMHEPEHAIQFADQVYVFGGPPLVLRGQFSRAEYVEEGGVDHESFQRVVIDALASAERIGV